MASPGQLSTASTVTSSDQVLFYSTVNGSTRKAPLSVFLDWFEANFASPQFSTQYAVPNVNGTNVAVTSTTSSTWLLISPTSDFAAMTITLPAATQIADGTELYVFCSKAVSALTIVSNGALGVYGAPTALAANSAFTLRYNQQSTSWYVESSALTVTQGTWTPVGSLAVAPVGTTFSGRYTLVGNLVTLEFDLTVANPGSFTFTTATDFFSGLPVGLEPTSTVQTVSSTLDSFRWMLFMSYNTAAAQWRMVFANIGAAPPATFTKVVPGVDAGTYRYVLSYLI